MNETILPTGCYDILPPYARLGGQLDYQLLAHFESYGYQQVSPPLLEYTESLLAGRGTILSPQVIRVMDPHAQKVMGLRADTTLQIARIATSRLADAARPLRLCYSGPILRMKGSATTEKRQMQQTGIELIGADHVEADAEVILVALRALQSLGIGHITLDLNLPTLIGAILAESSLDNDELELVFEALARKDSTRLAQFSEPACDLLGELMLIDGDMHSVFEKLEGIDLPDISAPQIARLKELVEILQQQKGDNVTLILDVTERGGMDYYSGTSFSFFATEHNAELGRGGRYVIDRADSRESAIGSTFYSDSLHRLMPDSSSPPRVYVVDGLAEKYIQNLHNEGCITVLALPNDGDGDVRNIARKLGCDHVYQSGELKKL